MKSFVRTDPTPDSETFVETTTIVGGPDNTLPVNPTVNGGAVSPSAVAVRPSLPVGRAMSTAAFEGEMGASDINKPVLTIVHGVGPRSALFVPGTIVLGDSIVFNPPQRPTDPTKKLRVVFGRVVKDYVQSLPYAEGGPRPMIVKTLAEVQAMGGTTEWLNGVAPSFITRVQTICLVRCPEGAVDDSLFSIIDGENTYAPAILSFSKTSYPAARTLLTDLQMRLKMDPTKAYFDLFWVLEKKGNNFVRCAKLERVRGDDPSEVVQKRLSEICGRSKPSDFEDTEA